MCNFQPDLVDKLIVEDIAPSTSLSLGLSESVVAMKNVTFQDKTLTSIAHARKLASHQLSAAFPVSSFAFYLYIFHSTFVHYRTQVKYMILLHVGSRVSNGY